ncbi:uncharacterized protein DAT39_003232 [Clarias magur]|uniref:CCHC-type domain-containing protein n=1 Tax=Clarias magur TaxID=1594786 RepID=A0A8J4UNH8_CLAMG|nr:uncharacterized protein DAT39_003232 [Clarias magur]
MKCIDFWEENWVCILQRLSIPGQRTMFSHGEFRLITEKTKHSMVSWRAFQQRVKEAFPVKMDMTKIAMCKQQPGESVSQYLTRLTEVHDANSGLERSADMSVAAITPYEAHLRNSFVNGLQEDIAQKVRNTCVGWDTGKLGLIEQHAVHAEKLVAQEKDKRSKKEDQSHSAQLAMLQMVKQTAGIQYRRCGRGRGGRGRGRTDGCFVCGSEHHWFRDCPRRSRGEGKSSEEQNGN